MIPALRNGALTSSSRILLAQRWLSSTSTVCMAGDKNDVTPARAHRKDSPNTEGGPNIDTISGEAKNNSTETSLKQQRRTAEGLADFAQNVLDSSTAQSRGIPLSTRRPRDSTSLPSLNTGILARLNPTPSSVSSSSNVQSPALAPSGYSTTYVPLRSDPILKKLINNLMRDGKKATATRHVLDMLQHLSKAMHADPLPAVKQAIEIASPLVRLQTRKTGGKNTQVPIVLFSNQSTRRGIMAIIEASRKRNDNTLSVRLAKEMIAVLEGNSAAVTRKMEVHRLASVNRSNTGVRV